MPGPSTSCSPRASRRRASARRGASSAARRRCAASSRDGRGDRLLDAGPAVPQAVRHAVGLARRGGARRLRPQPRRTPGCRPSCSRRWRRRSSSAGRSPAPRASLRGPRRCSACSDGPEARRARPPLGVLEGRSGSPLRFPGTWTSTPGAHHAPAVGARDRRPRPAPRRRSVPRCRRRTTGARHGPGNARARRGPLAGDHHLARGRPPRHRRRRRGHEPRRVGPPTGPRLRPAPRRVRRADAGARRRHRCAGLRLRGAVLHAPDESHRPPPRAARTVRRSDGRARRRRQPARAVRVLGAHVGHVVPADRQRSRGPQGPRRGACRRCS